jgi:hypothetical protein
MPPRKYEEIYYQALESGKLTSSSQIERPPGSPGRTTEIGSIQPASHGQVTLQRGLVPRIRRMVAFGCPHVPVLRREIAQPGGLVPDLCLMVTLIRVPSGSRSARRC